MGDKGLLCSATLPPDLRDPPSPLPPFDILSRVHASQMLALLYIALVVVFGDRLCTRWCRFASLSERIATAFLVGLLFSSWITYLTALMAARLSQPLLIGNLTFFAVFVVTVFLLPGSRIQAVKLPYPTAWDCLLFAAVLVFGFWLMFTTLDRDPGNILISFRGWSDFGANISLTQSFALGHNFPTEHPFFPGQMIRYHFLFWFQAGNLEFLGLNPVWSINLLSILSLLSLIVLLISLTESLFHSQAAARIAALLFFFSSSVAYIPFLRAQGSVNRALTAIKETTQFAPSGYKFRGEDWGVLTIDLYANQRHLISAVGLFLVALIGLIRVYHGAAQPLTRARVTAAGEESGNFEGQQVESDFTETGRASEQAPQPARISEFIFSGVVVGLLPYWNSAVYVAAVAAIVALLVILPRRRWTATLLVSALLIGLPQVLLLRVGTVQPSGISIFHWGYTLEHPTVWLVVKYLGWTFGLKWLLIAIALWFTTVVNRKLFLALSLLLAMVFLFRLSTDVFNNHKLLNVWVVFANCYAAFALWKLGKSHIAGTALAVVLALVMIFGGVIDFFAIRNDPRLMVPYKTDVLSQWVMMNSEPTDIFLTQTWLTHPILFSGRRIFLGYTLFAWTAGYNIGPREQLYRQMFEERDPTALVKLLRDNRIAFVAIDDGVRENKAIKFLNEAVYQKHFELVFEDTGHQYANVSIYRVPKGEARIAKHATVLAF